MSPKFAQHKAERERTKDPDVPKQPHVLSAAELPYKVNHAIPPRPTFQHVPKGSTSSATTSTYTSNYIAPYRQRLVAAALGSGTPDDPDPASSNDSSSAPSSNAISSGVGTSCTTSSSSPNISKGKAKAISANISVVTSVPRNPPTIASAPAQFVETPEFDPDTSYFESLMINYANVLPAPGLSYYEQRRALWTVAPPNPPRPSSPSPSRVKLEALLSQTGAVESEEVWRAGLKNVWKGLVGGNQLRKRLPLGIVLKILQAGWLRDGTWPEGMVAPAWDESMQMPAPAPPTPSEDPSQQGQTQSQQQRRAHEQEAYAAALHARASAEQASGAAQMMHMQAYAMMGYGGGIPPGYSPSSGDVPEDGYYSMPYAYSEPTPPPAGSDGMQVDRNDQGQDRMEGQSGGERERAEGLPSMPLRPEQGIESEMDTDDEEEDAEGEAGNAQRMEGIKKTGDGRHEGG